jgi:hypothetical protein
MPYTPNMRQEMLRLARVLLEQTTQEIIKWSVTDKEREFLFSSTKSSILIQGSFDYDDESEADFTLELLNRGGSVAARLEVGFEESDIPEETANYELLKQLYFEVQNKTLEIDTTLEDIHRALGMGPDSECTSPPDD